MSYVPPLPCVISPLTCFSPLPIASTGFRQEDLCKIQSVFRAFIINLQTLPDTSIVKRFCKISGEPQDPTKNADTQFSYSDLKEALLLAATYDDAQGLADLIAFFHFPSSDLEPAFLESVKEKHIRCVNAIIDNDDALKEISSELLTQACAIAESNNDHDCITVLTKINRV
jgi:hypothetical protein